MLIVNIKRMEPLSLNRFPLLLLLSLNKQWLIANCCRNTYKGGNLIAADPKLDWAANLSHMMGE